MLKHHMLELAKGLFVEIGRIGYATEGIRLTVGDAIPFNFHIELQLSRKDAEWIIKTLTESLENSNQDNMP